MSRRRQVALVVAAAAVVSQAYRPGNLGPIVIGVVLVVVNVLGAHWLSARRTGPSTSTKSLVAPLAACWLVVTLLPSHEFSFRSSGQAVSTLSLETMVEFSVFAGVGVVAVVVIRTFEPHLPDARPPAYLFLIPIWAIASAFWGFFGPYSLARGLQFIAISFLAWATVALGRHEPGAIKEIVGTYARWFVRITAVLAVLGVVWGPVYVRLAVGNTGRFSWIGAHPNASGVILTVAIVILVSTPARVLKLPPAVTVALTGAFLAAMYLNHSRTSWAGLIAGLGVVLVLHGRIQPKVAWVGFPLAGAAVTAALWLNGSAIWDYILRDRDTDQLRSGNGRIELWGIGFRSLDTAFDWLLGLGYGAARTIFLADAPWAGSAHNSTLSYLVSLGLVGVGTFFYMVVRTARMMLRGRLWSEPEVGVPVSALLVIVVLNSVATDTMAEPALGFAILCLVASVGIVASLPGASAEFLPASWEEPDEPDGSDGAEEDEPATQPAAGDGDPAPETTGGVLTATGGRRRLYLQMTRAR